MSIKLYLQTLHQYIKDQQTQSKESVRFYNWFGDNYWFRKFIHARKIPCSRDKAIAFFSVFGEKFPISINKSNVKVFFTGENLHRNEFGFSYQNYSEYLQNKHFDLSLGFDNMKADPYLRFPLWILPLVDPEDSGPAAIKALCDKISNHSLGDVYSKRFTSLVSGHDPNGLRQSIYDSLATIDEISCGGRFLNNTNELKEAFNNDKYLYMEQFKFNICPENSNSEGYVTEKVMEAIRSGAIPIYWGSNNNPEPELLNQDAIIFWNKDGDNTKNIELIRSLHQTPSLFKEFYSQPRLKPDAAEGISETLWNLESKLRSLSI